jgi:Protein of unknown function (DUF992)
MRTMINVRATLVGMLAAFAAALASAQEALVDLGTLTCTLVEPQAKSADTDSGRQFRDGRCTFKPGSGPEEIYEARIEGVSLTPSDGAKTVIWVVKGQPGTTVEPGLLEQLYEGARDSREDSMIVVFGAANAQLALHHMADKPEGYASAPQKPRPTGFVIQRIELRLKAAAG